MIRQDPLVQLIADDQAGRDDHAKQIWQLLTLELWYRNAQALRASPHDEEAGPTYKHR